MFPYNRFSHVHVPDMPIPSVIRLCCRTQSPFKQPNADFSKIHRKALHLTLSIMYRITSKPQQVAHTGNRDTVSFSLAVRDIPSTTTIWIANQQRSSYNMTILRRIHRVGRTAVNSVSEDTAAIFEYSRKISTNVPFKLYHYISSIPTILTPILYVHGRLSTLINYWIPHVASNDTIEGMTGLRRVDGSYLRRSIISVPAVILTSNCNFLLRTY